MIKLLIKMFMAEKLATSKEILGNISQGRQDKPGVWWK